MIAAKATVAPRNRNSTRDFIFCAVFADSLGNMISSAPVRSFISL